MFDTHCHLNFPEFENSLKTHINSARDKGVTRFLIPGTDYTSSVKAVEIANKYNGVYAAVGFHPTSDLSAKRIDSNVFKLEELISESNRIVAIGEIGLDYYHTSKDMEVATPNLQKEYFIKQLRLSIRLNLPVIIHNRLATYDIISSLEKLGSKHFKRNAVFHCCPADDQLLEFAIKNSIFIGIDGDSTYDIKKQEFIKRIPADLLVVETDSPNLRPMENDVRVNFPNTPSNLPIILQMVSKLKNIEFDKLQSITMDNSGKLLNIKI